MTALLSKAGSKLTVKQLLDTLQETMDFESSITRKFGTSVSYSWMLSHKQHLFILCFAVAGTPEGNNAPKRDTRVEADHFCVRTTYGRVHRCSG